MFKTAYSSLLKKAVKIYDKQHAAIAQNVANVNDPDYRRKETDFSHELQAATESGPLQTSRSRHIQSARWQESRLAPDAAQQGEVDLTREMSDLASNQIRHELVTRSLQRHYSGLTTAITGRNR